MQLNRKQTKHGISYSLIKDITLNDIVIEEVDTITEKAVKTALIHSSSGLDMLTKELKKYKVLHTKVQRGNHIIYVLRSKDFGRVEVIL